MIGGMHPKQDAAQGPWLSEMPQLLTQVARRAGSEVWRARTSSGGDLLARQITLPADVPSVTYLDRLRLLHESPSPHVASVTGAVWREDGVWVLYRPIAGVPMRDIVDGGDLDPARTVALGDGLLGGLAALHAAGLGQQVDVDGVQVDSMGVVRLEGPWLPLDVDAGAASAQVQAAGKLICGLLGVAELPGYELTTAERQVPALVAAARSLAASSARDAGSAHALLMEAAGGLAGEAMLARTRHHFAEAVRQHLGVPGIAPRPRPAPPPPPRARTPVVPPIAIGPRPTRDSIWRAQPPPLPLKGGLPPGGVLAGSLIALVLVLAIFGISQAIGGNRTAGLAPPTLGKPSAVTTARPTAQPATPTPGTLSAGDVKQVELAFDQPRPCAPGDSACQIKVTVTTNPLPQGSDVAWIFKITDLCTNQTVQMRGEDVTTQGANWNSVWGISAFGLPRSKRLQIVAQTTQPAVANSPPTIVGQPSC